MKNFYTLTVLAFAFAMGVSSASARSYNYDSIEVTPSVNESYNFSQSASSADESKPLRPKSSLEFDYFMLEDQSSLGASLVLGSLVFTGSYGMPNDLPDEVNGTYNWSVGAGINKRFYLLKFLYIEGRIGALYSTNSVAVEGSADPSTASTWGYFATPRAGLKLFENTCVTVGLNYNFANFKFDSAHTSRFMTAGVAFVF